MENNFVPQKYKRGDFKPITEEEKRICRIYNGMKQRCYNKNATAYKYYGRRGIKICDEWLNSKRAFVEWALSHGYRNDLSIDRINVDGNYEPDNCRWADAKTQANNKRPAYYDLIHKEVWWHNHFVEMGELFERYNVSPWMYQYRINKGLTMFHALTMRPGKTIEYYLQREKEYEERRRCREQLILKSLGWSNYDLQKTFTKS